MATLVDKEYLTFDDVLILPHHSTISTREIIKIDQSFLGLKLEVPIISSNMDYVTGPDMAIAMYKVGGLGILHRFMPWKDQLEAMAKIASENAPVAISVGVRDSNESLQRALTAQFNFPNVIVCIDVAHGDHEKVGNLVLALKSHGLKVIAGNVATMQGYGYLSRCGADAIKVGIGPGSVCTTREVTGAGVPQLTALMEIHKIRQEYGGPPIIADGGIKNSGDIVKALAAGADVVMLGNLLAGSRECPGNAIQTPDGRRWRPYRGQSIFGVNGLRYTPEGISGYVEEKGPVEDIIRNLVGGIRSGMSYSGASNLEELKEAIFIRVSNNTQIESGTRVRTTL